MGFIYVHTIVLTCFSLLIMLSLSSSRINTIKTILFCAPHAITLRGLKSTVGAASTKLSREHQVSYIRGLLPALDKYDLCVVEKGERVACSKDLMAFKKCKYVLLCCATIHPQLKEIFQRISENFSADLSAKENYAYLDELQKVTRHAKEISYTIEAARATFSNIQSLPLDAFSCELTEEESSHLTEVKKLIKKNLAFERDRISKPEYLVKTSPSDRKKDLEKIEREVASYATPLYNISRIL